MRGVSRSFPGVRALAGVDFTVRAGEIHALMGENGAGKSTLIKALTGIYPRDEGDVLFDGRHIAPASPMEAERLGISTVYQEINLLPRLSVAENIMLGRQPKRWGRLDWKTIHRRAEAALARVGIQIDVTQELAFYSVAIQQMTAIARALDIRAKLLILDEPTASLDAREVEHLFCVMRQLRSEGLGIVFITHFLDQVYQVSDRITVLRNGERVGEFETARLPRLELIGKMLGKEVREIELMEAVSGRESEEAQGVAVLTVEGLERWNVVGPLSFELKEGEVLGLAGLLGSGRTETARMLFGLDRADTGRVLFHGALCALTSPRKAIARGIGFCSEDRKTEGIIPHLSVRENIILAMQASRGALRLLSRREQLKIVERYIQALNIKTPSPDTPIRNLSGGNQQKVLLARWLALQPRVVILDEPTRGIDVGAKAEIENLVASLRKKGMAVLFISSELEEIVRNSQRVVVLRDRRQIGELTGADIEERRIMNMIAREA